jgi:hypothetical protein
VEKRMASKSEHVADTMSVLAMTMTRMVIQDLLRSCRKCSRSVGGGGLVAT